MWLEQEMVCDTQCYLCFSISNCLARRLLVSSPDLSQWQLRTQSEKQSDLLPPRPSLGWPGERCHCELDNSWKNSFQFLHISWLWLELLSNVLGLRFELILNINLKHNSSDITILKYLRMSFQVLILLFETFLAYLKRCIVHCELVWKGWID